MAFIFGNISKDVRPASLSKITAIDSLIENSIRKDEPYYIFLTDGKLQPNWLKLMRSAILKAGINSYVIVSSVTCSFDKTKIKSGIADFMKANSSDWKKFINYEGQHCSGIMTFGPALYSITGSADIQPSAFYADMFCNPYIYIGHGYCCDCDTFVVPVDAVESLYPTLKDPSSPPTNWRTRFFYKQLKVLANNKKDMPDMSPININLIEDRDAFDKILKDNMNSEAVSYDTETTGLDTFSDKVVCLTITWNGIDGYFIPWDSVSKRLLACNIDSCKHKITQNGKFDCKIMWNNGLPPYSCEPTDDTGQLAHAIHSDRPRGLKPLAYYYTYFGGYDNELDKFKKQTGVDDYSKIPYNILSKYAVMDAIATFRAYYAMVKQVHTIDKNFPNDKMPEWTLWRWYTDIMMPVYPDFIEMEYRGFWVDRDEQHKGQKFLLDKRKELEKNMAKAWNVPETFEFGSSTELGKLFEKLGWPCVERGKAGYYNTSESCLVEWKRLGKPCIDDLSLYRTIGTFLHTFMATSDDDEAGWNKFIKKDKDGDYKIHCNFNVNGTTSFRNIGSEPNTQQIPVHNDLSKYVMKMVSVPSIEEYTIEADDGNIYKGIATDKLLTKEGNVIEFKDVKPETNILGYYLTSIKEVPNIEEEKSAAELLNN